MSTCNQLDLQTLGSQPVMPKNLPDHWHTLLEFVCLVYMLGIWWHSLSHEMSCKACKLMNVKVELQKNSRPLFIFPFWFSQFSHFLDQSWIQQKTETNWALASQAWHMWTCQLLKFATSYKHFTPGHRCVSLMAVPHLDFSALKSMIVLW